MEEIHVIKETVFKFIEAINSQNLSLINEMMANDFYFIDTYGHYENKDHMKSGWKGYFEWFPDYCITIDDYIANEEFAMVIGKARGSYLEKEDKHWEIPAAWKVVVSGQQIRIWQVFCDSKKQLDSMN